MATRSGIRWVRPPAGLQRAIEQYGDRAWAAVLAVARQWAAGREGAARRNAPWEDRTGNARSGLFADVERSGSGRRGSVRVVLGHTMDYGVFLELSHGGRYAIVMRTLEEGAPELEGMLRDLVR